MEFEIQFDPLTKEWVLYRHYYFDPFFGLSTNTVFKHRLFSTKSYSELFYFLRRPKLNNPIDEHLIRLVGKLGLNNDFFYEELALLEQQLLERTPK